MYLTWGPSTWALLRVAPFYSVSFSSIYRNTDHWLLLVRESFLSLICFFTRDTLYMDRKRSSGQTHLFNIWTIGARDITSGQPQVKLSLLRSISLKNRPLDTRKGKEDGPFAKGIWLSSYLVPPATLPHLSRYSDKYPPPPIYQTLTLFLSVGYGTWSPTLASGGKGWTQIIREQKNPGILLLSFFHAYYCLPIYFAPFL